MKSVTQLAAAAAILSIGAISHGAITPIVEEYSGSSPDASYDHFTNIPAVSSTDLAEGVTPSPGGGFQTTANLTNGPDQMGGSDSSIVAANGGGWASEGSLSNRIYLDLPAVHDIGEINSYTWHNAGRLDQVYQVYGATGSEAGFVADSTAADPTTQGYTLIGSVDTRPKDINGNDIPDGTGGYEFNSGGGNGYQFGVSFQNINTDYKYFIFDIQTPDGHGHGAYYGEIDIVAAVPEPASAGLLLLGAAPLVLRRRNRTI